MSRSRVTCGLVALGLVSSALLTIGVLGCFPFGSFPDVNIDTSVFARSGYSRFSLEGEWVITDQSGQTRRAIFDSEGALVSFELPSREVFEPGEDDTVEVFVTSFGAFAILVRGRTEEAGRVITLHEFEALFDDDMVEMSGEASIVADDLSASRACDCRETWRLISP